MRNQLKPIMAFSTKRYLETRQQEPALAAAHLSIHNKAQDIQDGAGFPGDLIRFLNAKHTNKDLTKACAEVLEHLGRPPATS